MNAPSFKTMIKEGAIKRADAMKVRLQDIHEEPGFNLRDEGDELDASIRRLAEFITDGGQVPPLEVRPRAEGGVWIVDGHRRKRAFENCIENGVPLKRDDNGDFWVAVVAFEGNDAERKLRVMSSAEGEPLSALAIARGYAQLVSMGWKPEDIANRRQRTRQHVEQLLILANANSDVHALVKSGKVTATVAIDAVRKHGEEAGAFLAGKFGQAQAQGKARVTGSVVNGRVLPKKLLTPFVESMDEFAKTLDTVTRALLGDFERMRITQGQRTVSVDAAALIDLINTHGDLSAAIVNAEKRAGEKAAAAMQTDIEDA